MSLSVCSQPSLEITGRVPSRACVRWYRSSRNRARTEGSMWSRPKLSLATTQATIDGWSRSRLTSSLHSAARVIALVEDEALDVGLSVQQELPVPRLDLAHSEIAFDAVCLPAVQAQQSDLEVVEDRRIGRPRGDRIQLHATVAGPPRPSSDDFPIQPRDQLDTAFPANPEVDRTFGKVR